MKQKIWAWVRTLGGAAIIVFLVWRLGSGAFVNGLRAISPTALLAAFGIGVVATVASAWRWSLAARGLGIKLPLRTAVANYYQALFLNATLPGGLLGDVDRAVRNGRDSGDVGRGVRAVVLERFAGQVVLFGVGIAVLVDRPSLLRSAAHLALRTPPAVAVIAALAAAALAVFVGTRLRRRTSRWHRALRRAFSDVRLGLLARRNWPGVLITSGVVVAAHLVTFLLAARVAGSSVPAARLLPLMVVALVVMTLPVNVGGWGPREGFCAWAFGAAGLTAAQGLTIAVVYGLFALVASLPGIVVLVGRWARRFRAAAPSHSAAPASEPALAGSGLAAGVPRSGASGSRPVAAERVAGVPSGEPGSTRPASSRPVTPRPASTRPPVSRLAPTRPAGAEPPAPTPEAGRARQPAMLCA